MRPGFFLSILFHVLIFGSAYIAFPMAKTTMSEELIIVPIELVTIADTTNLPPPQPDEPEEEAPEPEPVPEPEEAPPEEEPIPEDDAEISDEPDPFAEEEGETESEPEEAEPIPEETPEPEEAPPEPEPEPTPEPEPRVIPPEEDKKEKTNSFLNSVLQTTEVKKKTREREFKAAPDLKKVENVNKNKRSAGDRRRATATWNALLRSKLETSGCYRDPRDMANVERLNVLYAITFNRDGTLMRSPRRLKPTIIPQSDRQLRSFDLNASRAIEKCAPYDDIFPAEHYEEWKDFKFNFGVVE